jgi:hypothetical protein
MLIQVSKQKFRVVTSLCYANNSDGMECDVAHIPSERRWSNLVRASHHKLPCTVLAQACEIGSAGGIAILLYMPFGLVSHVVRSLLSLHLGHHSRMCRRPEPSNAV